MILAAQLNSLLAENAVATQAQHSITINASRIDTQHLRAACCVAGRADLYCNVQRPGARSPHATHYHRRWGTPRKPRDFRCEGDLS